MSTTLIRGLTGRSLLKNLTATFREKFKAKETIMVAGQERTAESLAQTFEEAEQHYARADQAKARYHQSVDERDAALVQPLQLARDAVASLEVHWGNDPTRLAEAGIPPRKQKRALTSKEKFAAAEKRRLTRELRGTKGARQKAQLKAHGPLEVSTSASGGTQPSGATSTASSSGASRDGANVVVPAPNGANPIVEG